MLVQEVVKLAVCLLIVALNKRWKFFSHFFLLIRSSLLLSIPAALYFIQNFLCFLALQCLDPAHYIILGLSSQFPFHFFASFDALLLMFCRAEQLKILTAALFSVVLIHKHLSMRRWRSLVLLVLGVIQIVANVDQGFGSASTPSSPSAPPSWTELNPFQPHWSVFLTGVAAVLVMVSLSGFSGVFFERILKQDPDMTIWDRNIQLSLWSIPMGLVYTFFFDSQRDVVFAHGFFHGFSHVTWAWVLLSALGGILTAVVLRCADNIMKGYAISISVILTAVFSMYTLGTPLQVAFVTGVGSIIVSVLTFSEDDPDTQSPRIAPYMRLSIVHPVTPHYVVHPPSSSVSTLVVAHSDETLIAEHCDDEMDLLLPKRSDSISSDPLPSDDSHSDLAEDFSFDEMTDSSSDTTLDSSICESIASAPSTSLTPLR